MPMTELSPRVIALAATAALATLGLAYGSAQAGIGAAAKPAIGGASAAHPVVLELFQSQGCSSCPPANAILNGLADRPDLLALSFAVTYWDQLGWKDRFGSARFTVRQQDYAKAGRGQVATPELIVNGTHAIVGSNAREVAETIARAGPPRGGPEIAVTATGVRLAALAGPVRPSIVWLVRYDPGTRNVPIRAGENAGRTLPHRDIVRDLVRIGDWTGSAASYSLPAAREPGLATAILVQRGTGGPITAARRL
ncbi:DUF1223 domain-containing protein [Sphingomonas sp. CROZ-RG-20F-R02-07]|uniref:DUF1223 domain-containing protein n=1 Tax=Sphingomonas sp. CROZ-RG-20F-R02-07 TaxID=2914832 RepID=UPI001F596C3D|nr:DUF1223 domain-containing protein [Sphingomonas sp. CROZ-RG-20F-R02-07]